jgi:TrmH family RNA methyltransferase
MPNKTRQAKPKTVGITCILARPIHELNVGAAARACANFGAELRLVKPTCKIGFQTRLYAKHAWPLVKNAPVFKELLAAIKGFDLVIATTGVPSRFRSAEFKNCVAAAAAASKAKKAGAKSVALVFGSEDAGLTQEEIAACDFCAFIPTNAEYAVMNLSHAVAVTLYEFRRAESEASKSQGNATGIYKAASPEKRKALASLFQEIVERTPGVRDKKKVGLAFKRVLERACVAQDEAQALFAEFGELAKANKAKK